MCLAVPGQVTQIEENAVGVKIGQVCFGDVTKQVMLSTLPEVHVGDYVLVQYGMATSVVDKEQVDEILKFERELSELDEEEIKGLRD